MTNNQIRILGLIVVGMLLIIGLPTSSVQAANFTASDEASLVTAINNANANADFDVIELTANINLTTTTTYTFNGANGLPVITKPLAIIGNGYTIQRTSASQFRLLAVNATQLWLENVTLAGGNVLGSGGAVFAAGTGAALTLVDVTVGGSVSNGNTARDSGGGIYVAGNLSLSQSVISYNKSGSTATSSGMAVYVNATTSNTVTVSQTEIAYNEIITSSILSAGALSIEHANTTITDSWIHHNSSPSSGSGIRYNGAGFFGVYGSRIEYNSGLGSTNGGGIHVTTSNQAIIYGSVISNNVFTGQYGTQGGGIYLVGANPGIGSAIVDSSIIDGNEAHGHNGGGAGGGIAAVHLSSFSLINSQVSNNYVSYRVFTGGGNFGGGGVSIDAVSSSLIENTTISGNHAQNFYPGGGESRGGGLLLSSSTEIKSSTITNNVMESAGGAAGGGVTFDVGTATARFSNTILTGNFSLVAGVYNTENCYRQGGSPLMTVTSEGYNLLQPDGLCEALFNNATDIEVSSIVLGALANNGGLSFTHAINTTPPRNRANPLLYGSYVCSPTDQRGALRVGRCDIGAYEAGGIVPAANQTPSAGSDFYTTATNTAISALLSGNDSDPENQALYYSLASLPRKGFVTLNSDGNFSYTPMTGYSGTDSFSYIVCDRLGECSSANVTIAVNSAITMPAAPTLSLDSVGGVVVNLSWVDNSSDETSFVIERRLNTGIWSSVGNAAANATTFADNSVNCVYTYNYRVRAYRASDGAYSAASNIVNATTTVCPPPPNFAGIAAGYQSIQLTWDDIFADESFFSIERSSDGGSSWTTLPSQNANTKGYINTTGLTCGTSYQFRIRVQRSNPAMNGDYSSPITVSTAACPPLPPAPTNLTSTQQGYTYVRLEWEDNATDEAGYRIEGSTDGGVTFTTMETTDASFEFDWVSFLSCGTTYQFRVRTHRTNPVVQFSEPSNTITVSTLGCPALPNAPTNLAYVNSTFTSIQISWTDNASDENNYLIERSSDGTTWSQLASLAANTTSYTNTALPCGTSYQYRVRVQRDTPFTQYSAFSNVLSSATVTCPAVPDAPTNLTATGTNNSIIRLDWLDNATTEEGYRIEYSTNGTTWSLLTTVAADVTTYNHTGHICLTTRHYRIRGYNLSGDSAWSTVAIGTTLACPPTAPSALTRQSRTQQSITLIWTDNSNNETEFVLQRRQVTTPAQSFVTVATLPANTTTYTDPNLYCTTSYEYRIAAYRSDANAISTYATLSTSTLGCTNTPLTPTNRVIDHLSASSIELRWTDNATNETNYVISRRSIGSGGALVLIATLPANTTSFVDSGLTCAPEGYAYEIRAFNSAEGSFSSALTTGYQYLQCAPAGFVVESSSQTSVRLDWSDLPTPSVDVITTIRIERSADAGASWQEVASVTYNPSTYLNTGLGCGTDYQYRIRSYSPSNGEYSDYTAVANISTLDCYEITEATCTMQQLDTSATTNLTTSPLYLSGDGQRLATFNDYNGSNPVGLNLYDLTNGSLITTIPSVLRADIDYDGNVIAFTSTGNHTGQNADGSREVFVWNNGSISQITQSTGFPSISEPAISDDGNTIVFSGSSYLAGGSSGDTFVYVWDAVNGLRVLGNLPSANFTSTVAISGDGTTVAFQQRDSVLGPNLGGYIQLYLWDAVNGVRLVHPFTNHVSPLTDLALNYDGSRLLFGATVNPFGFNPDASNEIFVWDEVTGLKQLTEGSATDTVWPVSLDGSGQRILLATTLPLDLDDTSNPVGYYLYDEGIGFSQLTFDAKLGWPTYGSAMSTDGQTMAIVYPVDWDGVANVHLFLEIMILDCSPDNHLPAPDGLTSDSNGTTMSLSWDDNSLNETAFSLERSDDGSNWTEIAELPANTSSYDDSITACTEYQYRVRAYRLSDDVYSDYSNLEIANSGGVCPPDEPTNLTVDDISETAISLSWTDNATDETEYRLFRSDDGGETWTEIAQPAADSTSYADSDITCDISYEYRIRAYRLGDDSLSAYSNIATATTDTCPAPAAPTALTVSATGHDSITVSWTASLSDVTTYRVERSTNSGTSWTELISLPDSTSSYTDTGLSCTPGYQYRVRAYRLEDAQFSTFSNVVTSNCAPVALPNNFQVYEPSTTQTRIHLIWENNVPNETGYRIEFSTNGTTWGLVNSPAANSTSYTHINRPCGTTYFYRIRSNRTSDGQNSAFSQTLMASTLPCSDPIAPSLLGTSPIFPGTGINLSWVDNSSDETNFRIERSTDSGVTWTQFATVASNTTSYSDTSTTCNTEYRYRVRAYRSFGNAFSIYTNTAIRTTGACSALVAPTVPTVEAQADGIMVSWTESNPNETNYRIERSANGGASWTEIAQLPANSTSYIDSDIVCATSYLYQLRAYRATDNSYSPYSFQRGDTSNNCATVLVDEVCTYTALTAAIDSPSDIRMSGDGQRGFIRMQTGSDDIQVWDLNSKSMIDTIPDVEFIGFDVDEDGSRVAFISRSNLTGNNADASREVFLWDNGSISQITDSATIPGWLGVYDVSISSDGTKISFVIEQLGAWEIGYWVEGTGLLDLVPEAQKVANLVMSGDGNTLAFLSHDLLVPEAVEGEPLFYLWDAVNGISSIGFPSEYPRSEFPATTDIHLDETGSTLSFRLTMNDNFSDVYIWNAADGFFAMLNPHRPAFGLSSPDYYYDRVSGMSADGQRMLLFSRYNITGENPDLFHPTLGAIYGEYYFVENGAIRQITSTIQLDEQPITYAMSDDGSRILIFTMLPQPTNSAAHAASETYVVIGDCEPLPMSAPSALAVDSADEGSIDLSWNNNTYGETNYRLERSEDGGASWTEIAQTAANSTSYSDTDLTCDTSYQYRLRAYRAADASYTAYSNVVTGATEACLPPDAPTDLSVTDTTENSISLEWTDNVSDETEYRLERSEDGGENWTEIAQPDADATSYSNTGLSCNTTYEYRLRAYREGDEQYSDYSDDVAAACAAPLAPTALSVSATSHNSISLSWTDNAVNETSYRIEVSTNGGANWLILDSALPADSTSYTDADLSCNISYQYRVRANRFGDSQNSNYSNVVTATCAAPLAPTVLTVTDTSDTSISLSWTDNALNETGYHLERSDDGGTSWTEIVLLPADSSSYSNIELDCNTGYQYRVRAYRFGDEQYSDYSNVATGTTELCPPDAPTALTVTANSHNSISLAWTDNADDETEYRVERSTDAGTSWSEIAQPAADATSYGDSGLTCDTSYEYRVRLYRAGDEQYSAYSNVVAAACAAPLAPTALSVSATSHNSISLSWTDNAVNETSYRIEVSTNGGANWLILDAALPADSTSYTDADLSCNISYQYRVRANRFGDSQNSDYSNLVTATCAAPLAPTVLSVTDVTETSISLSWTDNAVNETAYSLERSDDGISWTEIALPAADATSYSNTGLSCNTTYDYRVRAYRFGDEQYSTYSNVVTETTTACPPAAPTGLTITGTAQTTVSLSWTDNASDETSYLLERSLDGVTWVEVEALAANSTSHTDTGLSCNTNYQYRVRASRSGDSQFSAYSNVATGTTTACPAPLAPTTLSITGTSSNSVSLAWTDNASDETSYLLERSADAGASWSEIAQPAANATSYSDTTALCNTSYDYRVRAYRAGDAQFSDYSNVATGTTSACIVLNAPTDIQLTASTETTLSISWTDNSSNESGYEIERSLDGTNWTLMSSLPADSTSYTDSGLTCSHGYQYRIRSNHLGTGTYSPYGTSTVFTTVSCPALVASVLSSTGSTANSISLSWTVDSNGTSFTLAFYNGLSWVNLGIFPSTTTTYTHTGLACNTSYQYQVTTFRTDDSASVTSGAFSTGTAACPPMDAPNAPVVLNTEPALVSLQIPAMPASATSMSLERSTDGISWTNLGAVSMNYIDTAVVCGSSYQYRLVASRSSDGATSTSATAIALTDACPIPTVLGVYRSGLWVFVDSNNTATPVNSFNFGDASWQPLVGDWDGDGIDGVGIYRNGEFALRNIASADSPETRFSFGAAEAGWQAIVGDWDGNGSDSVGLYKDGLFILSNDNVNIQYRFNFGGGAGWQAVAGDWDGNGADGIGLYKDGIWMLAEDVNNPGGTSIMINYGPAQAGWTAIVGDWNGDGRDSIGLYSNGLWRMRVSNIHDTVENSMSFGQTGDIPLAIFEN